MDDECYISWRLLHTWTMEVTWPGDCYICGRWMLHIWATDTYLDGYISARHMAPLVWRGVANHGAWRPTVVNSHNTLPACKNTACNCNINSSPHRAAYMRHWIGSPYLQIMAWCLFGWIKPGVLSIGPLGKVKWNFNQNTKLSLHKNPSETIVCEMDTIQWLLCCSIGSITLKAKTHRQAPTIN